MSASREKNKRKEEPVETPGSGNYNSKKKKKKKGLSKGLKWTLGIICAVLVIAIVTFFAMLTGGFFVRNTTAAVADGHNLSPAMVDYFYKDAYASFSKQYSSYLSYILDTNTPLDEQVYDKTTGETWADYFMKQGLQNASQVYAIYDEATKNGYTLSADDQKTIDSTISSFQSYATASGASLNALLVSQFGTGCNEKTYRQYLEVTTVAQSYSTKIYNGFSYTADDLSKEYAANPNDYDGVDFRVFPVTSSLFASESSSSDSSSAASSSASSSAASSAAASSSSSAVDPEIAAKEKTMASDMADAAKGDEQKFIDLAYQNASSDTKDSYKDDAYTLKSDTSYSSCSSTYTQEMADWLFDSSRQAGDTTFIASSDGYNVAFYVGRENHDYKLVNVRHILISVSDTTDTTAMATAKAKAESILKEYEAGDKTEDAFAALAKKDSEDTGTASNGGLYENVVPGQTVTAFNDWCYDSSRQPGDTGVIESSYGYHVMYFVNADGKNYRDYLVENALRSNDFSSWNTKVTGKATYTENALYMRLTTK
jgi:hypothetical protein